MPKTYQDFIAEAKQAVKEVTAEEVRAMTANGGQVVLLDVREKDEYREGHLEGAVHLSRGFLEFRAPDLLPDRQAKIVVY